MAELQDVMESRILSRTRKNATRWFLKIAIVFLVSAQAHADPRADSLALFGGWRWLSSSGGLMGTHATPPPTGWTRTLFINRDGTYSHWERDSVANYLLHQGRHTIHRLSPAVCSGSCRWVEFSGWRGVLENNSHHITFVGEDTVEMYPGSGDVFVSDALTDRYVRDSASPPAGPSTRPRPPRIQKGNGNFYYVDLDSTRRSTLQSLGTLRQWADWQYPLVVRETYRYRNDQIPSAVIGDFDADSMMDVVMYGITDDARTRVVYLLSNGGIPVASQLFEETTQSAPDHIGRQRPSPALYLMLLRAGESAKMQKGTEVSFPSDAILVSRPDGYATPYYYEKGAFRQGAKISSNHWAITDPR